MKKIINILTFALLLMSCDSFLEEKNKAGITNDELYSTPEGYQTLRVNAYSSLRIIYDVSPMVLLAGTDLYQMPRGTSSNGIYDYTNLTDNNGDVSTYYKECYQVIQAINTARHYLDIAEIPETEKQLYTAEYDFMSGFVHFLLIEQFGGIVINDEYTQSPRVELPRSGLAESYEFVLGKLKDALDGPLPQTTRDGTICKDIVNHYLAKVYLTRGWDLGAKGDFAEAKSYAQKVIATRGGLRYTMEELWSADNENNEEVIFAIQYDEKSIPNTTSGNNQESLFGPYLGGNERGHKYMTTELYPSWSVHSWFGKTDARYDATFMLTMWEHYYDYYQGKNTPGVDAVTAIYPRAWDKAEEMFNDYLKLTKGQADGVFVDVSMTDDDRQLIDGAKEFIRKWCPEYEDVDVVGAMDDRGGSYLKIYPFIEHAATQMANETYWRTGYNNDFCQPVVKKFDMNKLVNFHTRQSYRDVVLATLSETMLLYAEACIGEENYPEAQNYINQVLARPGNTKDGSILTCTLPTSSQEAALEAYLKESGKELLGQYCGRWPELRRTKMIKKMYYTYNYDYLTGRLGTDPVGNKLYRPIPQAAMEINEALTEADQNPGY